MTEVQHISTVEDMDIFDELPAGLQAFLRDLPVGVDCAPVRELYRQKMFQGFTPEQASMAVQKVLRVYLTNVAGVHDFRPLGRTRSA